MSRLQGKVAIVTGGNSGIGLATAKEFAKNGAQVVITGRDELSLNTAVQEIGNDTLALVADVTDFSALDHLVETVKSRYDGVDVVFINAGIARMAPIDYTDEAVFDEVMNINFKGAYFTIQKLLPILNEGASIVLNGSVNTYVGFPNTSVYAASKAALHSLARTLSAEFAERRIRVNTLNIGPVDTPLFSKVGLPEEAIQGFAQAVTGKLTVSRFGNPDEIAKAAVFLASDDSSFVVGSEVTTDGGMMLNSL